MSDADIGLIGLAVMGENLVLNMANHGFTVAVFNRTTSKVDEFLAGRAAGKSITGTHSIEELCGSLKRPRRVMIMVKAGAVVEGVIESLLPYLEPGDVVIDGGNSQYPDSTRRTEELAEKGILFIGTGVSGGEEGALTGPSIMPGGNPDAWPLLKPIFQAIAAKTDEGEPCCEWVGKGGADLYPNDDGIARPKLRDIRVELLVLQRLDHFVPSHFPHSSSAAAESADSARPSNKTSCNSSRSSPLSARPISKSGRFSQVRCKAALRRQR